MTHDIKEIAVLTRRQIVLGAAAAVAVPTPAACGSNARYEAAVRSARRHGGVLSGDRAATLRELVRYATLAPSSHNTQCWKFRIEPSAVTIKPDFSRRCPAVDPDDHHLFVSLGCAAENLVQAALANGHRAEVSGDTKSGGGVRLILEPTTPMASPLFQAIVDRQSTRGDYDGQPVSPAELRLLEQAGMGSGVRVQLLTARPMMERVLEYVVAGNTAQMNDSAFVDELKLWIRFSADEALRAGDGLYAGASGNAVLPRWLASPAMSLFFNAESENERYARQIRNSAGIAVFVSEVNDKAHWVEVGRSY